MALKSKYATKAEIPEGQATFYVEKDGVFILDADLSDHPTVVGLRDNRDAILTEKKTVVKERDEARSSLETIKAEAGITDLAELPKVLKGKKTEKDPDIEKLLVERTGAMKGDYEKTIKQLTDENGVLQSERQVFLIETPITAGAAKAGVRSEAVQDVLLRGRNLYRLVDGKPTPMVGDKVIYGKDGVTPMPIDEWLGHLTTEAPHLFNPSQGGGARPGDGQRGQPQTGQKPTSSVELIEAGLKEAGFKA